MPERIENRNVTKMIPLISPRALKARFPLPGATAAFGLQARRAIREILRGQDTERLVVVVGPCSIHDPEAAFEYAERLKRVADKTSEQLVIVMRTYFEKPRTTVGWKGLINDPRLDGSCDIGLGLQQARKLLLRINNLGLPCATEMLDPVTPQYIADLISWAAIGARTIESQTHREMASGLSMPVGFKNGTDGNLQVALNAMLSAKHPHSFLGVNENGLTAIVKTIGNPDRHLVLRGSDSRTNYAADDVHQAIAQASDELITRSVMVDCSHGNSGKDHTRQGRVCREVVRQFREGQNGILGVMLESNLKAGKQTWRQGGKLGYGLSITDACIGWEETAELLYSVAAAVEPAHSL